MENKDSKGILPINEPIVTFKPIMAAINIVAANNPDNEKWVFNHFVQITLAKNGKNAYFIMGSTSKHKSCPLIGHDCIPGLFVSENYNSLTEFIKMCIKNNYYMYFDIDRYYIKNYKYDRHRSHEIFVYGFDDQLKMVYIADFFDSHTYSFEKCSYEEINKAYINVYDLKNNYQDIHLFRTFGNKYDFDERLLKIYLEDYLNSTNSYHRMDISRQYGNKLVYGLSTYDTIIELFNMESENGRYDYRIPALHLTHKRLMDLRLDFLYKNQLICLKRYQSLKQKMNVMLKLINTIVAKTIKYNYKKNREMVATIIIDFEKLKYLDEEFSIELLNAIIETEEIRFT